MRKLTPAQRRVLIAIRDEDTGTLYGMKQCFAVLRRTKDFWQWSDRTATGRELNEAGKAALAS